MRRWLVLVAVVTTVGVTWRAGILAQTSEPRPVSTVQQLMRSIFFVNANVVFAGQVNDPASLPRDSQSSLSTNPLTGLYGGWQALENSGLALADAAELLNVRGRACSNGKPAPINEAGWKSAVETLRTTGIAAAAAARARSQEQIFKVSEELTNACAACHRLYRARGNPCAVSP